MSPSNRDSEGKQQQIKSQRRHLPREYSDPLTDKDRKIVQLSLSQLVSACNSNTITPSAVLLTYGKRALIAHDATNCLSDIMIDEVDPQAVPLQQPLSGVVVSLKDCVDVAGHDTTLGYLSNAGQPKAFSAPIVHLLRDAGALMPVKTTVPAGLLSMETTSDLFGETTNPHNSAFSPGASTGGGCALLAQQGSMIEVATDVGGSVRFPAAFCGLYSVKSSVGRFPAYGCVACAPGAEGVPTVTSPIARTLDDLEEFWRRVVQMQPWVYDHTCVPLPWRPVDFVLSARKPKWGVLWSDGLIPPTPAAVRAMNESVDALRKAGHEVVDFHAPSVVDILTMGYQLAFADGGHSLGVPFQRGEFCNGALLSLRNLLQLPQVVKKMYAFMLRLASRPYGRNDAWAHLVESLHTKTVNEVNQLVIEREAAKAAWKAAMNAQGLDFVLTVPHALPSVPRGGSEAASMISAGYTFLFNVLDLTAGVVPITYVDKSMDQLPSDFQQSEAYQKLGDVARSAYTLYDAAAMHGLPLAVQIAGGRLEEEKVIAGMRELERALWDAGEGFVPKTF